MDNTSQNDTNSNNQLPDMATSGRALNSNIFQQSANSTSSTSTFSPFNAEVTNASDVSDINVSKGHIDLDTTDKPEPTVPPKMEQPIVTNPKDEEVDMDTKIIDEMIKNPLSVDVNQINTSGSSFNSYEQGQNIYKSTYSSNPKVGVPELDDKEISEYIANRKLIGGMGNMYEKERSKTPKLPTKPETQLDTLAKPTTRLSATVIPPSDYESPIFQEKVNITKPNKAPWLIMIGVIFLVVAGIAWFFTSGKALYSSLSFESIMFWKNESVDEPPETPTPIADPIDTPVEQTNPDEITLPTIINEDQTLRALDSMNNRNSDDIKNSLNQLKLETLTEELNKIQIQSQN